LWGPRGQPVQPTAHGAHAASDVVRPLPASCQIEPPISVRCLRDEEKKLAWFKSLAAFMARQPGDHRLNVTTDFRCTQALKELEPWLNKLTFEVSWSHVEDGADVGKVIERLLEVGMPGRMGRTRTPCHVPIHQSEGPL
jgi:hypothetical protein